MEEFLRYKYVLRQLRIIRRHKAKSLTALERTNNLFIGMLQNTQDFPFTRTSRLLRRCHTGHNPVTMHRRTNARSRYEYIGLIFSIPDIRDDKAKSLRRH